MDSVQFSRIRRSWGTHILEHARAFVAGWGIKVGTATGCGMNEGRTPRAYSTAICGNAAGTRGGEDLVSFAGPQSAEVRSCGESQRETKRAVEKVRGAVSSSSFSIAGGMRRHNIMVESIPRSYPRWHRRKGVWLDVASVVHDHPWNPEDGGESVDEETANLKTRVGTRIPKGSGYPNPNNLV
ncbi:hypothetical protein BGW80DRAFT_1257406 [Lactifluus volemus]|nr:hypothetical protein BGW80DRAFT_1257406 [Lactifluus volemus]